MEFVIAAVVVFVLFTVLGIIATVKTARAVRRSVERTSSQVRRTVEETALKARTAQPGPVGEAARIRLELRTSLNSTRAALSAGASDDPALREAAALLDRLQGHARQLDGELRLLMEGEPDRTRIAERLPEARERAEELRKSADSLRFAAQDRARQYDEDGLEALRGQIEIESGALRGFREPPQRMSLGGGAAETDPGVESTQRKPESVEGAAAPGPAAVEPPRDTGEVWPEPKQSPTRHTAQHWSETPTVPGFDTRDAQREDPRA